ncbi:MAG: glycosyltransferase [Gemmatimonadaceae bacterium]
MQRALFVMHDAEWSGAARAFSLAARGLAGHGRAAFVMAAADSPAHAAAQRDEHVAALELPLNGAALARVLAIRSALRTHDIDVVFVQHDADRLAAAIAMLGRRERTKLVRRVGAGERLRPTRAGRLADSLVPATYLYTGRRNDPAAAPAASNRYRADLGVELPGAPREMAQRTTPLLACTYDVAATLKASRVLRAVAMLRARHRDLTLCMLGRGDVPERLRMQAAALGLSRVVRWMRSPGDVAAVLDAAWCLVVAVDGDDGVFAALDGMAAATPVIAVRDAIFERYIANGISGILLDRFDACSCAAALATLLGDADRRMAMGGAGRSRVAREYTPATLAAGIDGLLRALGGAAAAHDAPAGVA